GPQTIEVSWLPASDVGKAEGALSYAVYLSTQSGVYDFDLPLATTAVGRTMYTLTDLEPDTEYFVVRAIDPRSNIDPNVVEASDSTWPDTIAPTWGSAPVVSTTGLTSLFIDWEDASDDVDEANEIVYEVFAGPTSDAINFATALVTTEPGATQADLTGLIPGDEYFVAVRATDSAGNATDSSSASGTTTPDTEAADF